MLTTSSLLRSMMCASLRRSVGHKSSQVVITGPLMRQSLRVAGVIGGGPWTGSATTTGARSMSMLSFHGPRRLSEITKLPLLAKKEPHEIREIWDVFHSDKSSNVSTVISPLEAGTIRDRARECPMFVLPVPRGGGIVNLVLQFQWPHCLMAQLESWKQDPMSASPVFSLTWYEELVAAKGIVLVRGDASLRHLKRLDAERLMHLTHRFYLDTASHALVRDFNLRPAHFDFNNLMTACNTP